MDWSSILESAATGLGFGLPVSLLLIIAGHFLKKDLEKSLIVFSQLHRERARTIKKLYRYLAILERNHSSLYGYFTVFETEDYKVEDYMIETESNAHQSYIDYVDYFQEHKVFFPKKLADLQDKLCIKLNKYWKSRVFLKAHEESMQPEQFIKISKEMKEIIDELPSLKDEIEEEFRKIMGIDRKIIEQTN